jgi:hypothetical protein
MSTFNIQNGSIFFLYNALTEISNLLFTYSVVFYTIYVSLIKIQRAIHLKTILLICLLLRFPFQSYLHRILMCQNTSFSKVFRGSLVRRRNGVGLEGNSRLYIEELCRLPSNTTTEKSGSLRWMLMYD